MLLIGSSAIKHHFPDFPRNPKDIDYTLDETGYKLKNIDHGDKQIEYHYNPILNNMNGIASPDVLYTLKISHCIGWDINWEKHIFDIQFLKKKNCQIIYPLIFDLYNFWNEYHCENKRSKLNMKGNEFFDNALKLKYPHDFIHTLINPYPTYKKVLKDGEEVDVSEDKFNNLTHEKKCCLVREEVYVMSWERYSNFNYRKAYSIMLKKFILHHAPIWESIFIIENFVELHLPIIDFFNIINSQLNKFLCN
jgi:hypothetical protein